MIASTCSFEEIQVDFLALRTVCYRGRHTENGVVIDSPSKPSVVWRRV